MQWNILVDSGYPVEVLGWDSIFWIWGRFPTLRRISIHSLENAKFNRGFFQIQKSDLAVSELTYCCLVQNENENSYSYHYWFRKWRML
jgi:hypothetical protein